ncbi:type II secretion system F family protein [Baia soyae]|uniref:Tight adherence protein C n=1 Tax=Baia soyae TaxID=1544746 RepID=A0A4R2RXJ4_9BACL|nr:type II secretion system F family protein [Baia soyae]TCP69237.1 tight adherence protein C [Baia soyae]
MALLVISIWLCLLFAGISYYSYVSEHKQVEQKLDYYIPPWRVMKRKRRYDRLWSWVDRFAETGEKISILSDPVEIEEYLTKAGYPYGLNLRRVHGAKILGAISGFGAGFFYVFLGLPFGPALFPVLVFLGYSYPILLLRVRAKQRQEQLRLDLPNFLDMMSITLQAGMGLDEAIRYYIETSEGPLTEELARLNQEIRFGVQREAAYRALINRTDSPELDILVQSLIQAHILGTSVAKTFTEQADDMRQMRAEQAKEKAGKATPKVSLVTGVVIFPSILLLIGMFIIYTNFISKNIFSGF